MPKSTEPEASYLASFRKRYILHKERWHDPELFLPSGGLTVILFQQVAHSFLLPSVADLVFMDHGSFPIDTLATVITGSSHSSSIITFKNRQGIRSLIRSVCCGNALAGARGR